MGFLRVSDNGHYFVRDGKPFFWMGDTIWPVPCEFSIDELDYYFRRRSEQGFNVAHIMLPYEDYDGGFTKRQEHMNVYDIPLWLDNNPATPNEAFFEQLDDVIRLAEKYNILLSVLAMGGGWGCYVYHRKIINAENARVYGKWLGERYKDEPNIVWSNGFDLPPWWFEDVAQAFAAGLQEGDRGNHLLFYHPCGSMSSNHFHQEEWLSGNFIQTWASRDNIHRMMIADYHRRPYKPVVHVEGAYEGAPEYGEPITALLARQQAYWSYLSGGFHTYGHGDIWRKPSFWRESMESYGGNQMKILKDFFTSLEWWKLVPDQSLFTIGIQEKHVAARSADNDFAVIYFGHRATLPVDVGSLGNGNALKALWIDPQSGKRIDGGVISGEQVHSFTTHTTCDDALLLLTAE